MALFQTEYTPSGGVNYTNMDKERMIRLLQSRNNEIDLLTRKLEGTAAVEAERNRLAQQVAALTAENEALRSRVAEQAKQPVVTAADVTEPGSIAELSFKVNGVMDAAQRAADDYLAKIKEMHDKMSRQYSEYELNAQRKADAIVKNANEEAASIVKKAREEVNAIWSALQTKFDGYVAEKKQ